MQGGPQGLLRRLAVQVWPKDGQQALAPHGLLAFRQVEQYRPALPAVNFQKLPAAQNHRRPEKMDGQEGIDQRHSTCRCGGWAEGRGMLVGMPYFNTAMEYSCGGFSAGALVKSGTARRSGTSKTRPPR